MEQIFQEVLGITEIFVMQVVGPDDDMEERRALHAKKSRGYQSFTRGSREYFLASDGDREIYGWMVFRESQLMLHMSCWQYLFVFPESHPEERIIEYRARTLTQITPRVEGLRTYLDLILREADGEWVDKASSLRDELQTFEEMPEETCEATAELWGV